MKLLIEAKEIIQILDGELGPEVRDKVRGALLAACNFTPDSFADLARTAARHEIESLLQRGIQYEGWGTNRRLSGPVGTIVSEAVRTYLTEQGGIRQVLTELLRTEMQLELSCMITDAINQRLTSDAIEHANDKAITDVIKQIIKDFFATMK